MDQGTASASASARRLRPALGTEIYIKGGAVRVHKWTLFEYCGVHGVKGGWEVKIEVRVQVRVVPEGSLHRREVSLVVVV